MDPRTAQLLARRPADGSAPAAPKSAWRQWVETHRTLAGAGAAGVVALAFAAHYAFVTLPAARAERISRAEQAAGDRRAADDLAGAEGLDACLATAQGTHRVEWDQACFTAKRKPNCTLPRPEAAQLDERHRQARAQCLKQYSIR